jgi:ABC-type multidrug transport system ATPase subunit
MMVSTGTVPSVVFLDEVTTNIDPLGVQGIYNMISELAEEKQVFVTTHDADLIRMLHGANTISLCHEKGITKMVN